MLDNKRLGKQRVEALQILNTLSGKSKGWRNHPAVLMWYGYEDALRTYHDIMVMQWMDRGFKNTMPFLSKEYVRQYPEWMSDYSVYRKIICSHRSNLLRKDPEFYGKYGWNVGPDLPYVWPVTKEDVALKRVLEVCA
jgi:hypothetical protein